MVPDAPWQLESWISPDQNIARAFDPDSPVPPAIQDLFETHVPSTEIANTSTLRSPPFNLTLAPFSLLSWAEGEQKLVHLCIVCFWLGWHVRSIISSSKWSNTRPDTADGATLRRRRAEDVCGHHEAEVETNACYTTRDQLHGEPGRISRRAYYPAGYTNGPYRDNLEDLTKHRTARQVAPLPEEGGGILFDLQLIHSKGWLNVHIAVSRLCYLAARYTTLLHVAWLIVVLLLPNPDCIASFQLISVSWVAAYIGTSALVTCRLVSLLVCCLAPSLFRFCL